VILTSTIKRVNRAVYDLVMGVAADTPLTGTQRFDLARDGVGYAISNPAIAIYRAAADAAATEIRSGRITVRTR
jgi:basic membrane protein A and related proteins